MPDINPYESPRTEAFAEPPPVLPPGEMGLWRRGPFLVMHEMARFPQRCLMTGENACEMVRWQARGLVEAASIKVPLSPKYIAGYWWRVGLAAVCLLVGVGAAILWRWARPLDDTIGPTLLGIAGVVLSAVVYGTRFHPMREITATCGSMACISSFSPTCPSGRMKRNDLKFENSNLTSSCHRLAA